MKSYFIQIFTLLSLFNILFLGAVEVQLRERIYTRNNKVGVKENEFCYVIYDPKQNYDNAIIICKNKSPQVKLFKNVGKIVGSSTGTPGWLEYSNYIGHKPLDSNKPGLVGGGRRVIFCDGPCKTKE